MDGSIVHVAPSSLYRQVTDDLLGRIAGGQFKPGVAMPTEQALCRHYGVSRITVRRALADLVARGLVVRRRGIGSFVTGRPAAQREFHLVGFLDDALAFASRTLLDRAEPADQDVAAALRLGQGTAVRHVRSVVHREGEPFTITDSYTAGLAGRSVPETGEGGAVPFATLAGRRLGRRIDGAEQELDAVAADEVVALHLNLPSGSPVIRARRVYFGAGNEPILYFVVRYHPDRYRFVVDLVPRAGAASFTAHS